jgi:rubrerythrin
MQTIIDFAIEKEKEAADFYGELARRVKLKVVADEIRKIVAMENGHRERLERMDLAAAAERAPEGVMDLHIADYVVEAKPSPDMSWPDILTIAMHREQASVNLYTDLEKLVTDSLSKQLFRSLASDERGHKLFFEKIWDDEVLASN